MKDGGVAIEAIWIMRRVDLSYCEKGVGWK